MNPYDLSQTDSWMPDTYGYRKGCQTCMRMRVMQVLVALVGGIGIAFLLLQPFGLPRSPKSYLMLTVSSMIFLFALYWAAARMAVRKVRLAGVSAQHDYNYGLYRKMFSGADPERPRRTAQWNQLLLRMARQDLLLRKPGRALNALELVRSEKLNKEQLKSLYFYQAVAMRCLGMEEQAAEALERCCAIPSDRPGFLNSRELENLFRVDTPAETLLEAVTAWDKQKLPSWPAVALLTGLWTVFSGWYFGVQGLLPENWHYRSGFVLASTAVIWLGGLALLFWLTARLIRWLWRREELPGVGKGVCTLGVLCLCFSVALLEVGPVLGQALDADQEVEELEGGLLLMRHENFLDPDEYYYSQAVGPLLRRSLESWEYDQAVERYGSLEDEGQTERQETELPPLEDTSEADEDALHRAECLAIYQLLCDQGEIETPDADGVTFSYSAKGSLYTVFQSGSDGGEDWQHRLVYDRVSKNGQCDLFVYYVDRTGADGQTETGILEFYAVNQETLEVIPGEKTGWSDPGSQAYREASGE